MGLTDIMTTDLPAVSPQDNLCDVARQMRGRGVKALPVCEQDELVGIITDWDLAMALAESSSPSDATAADRMTSDVVTAGPATSFSEALALMGRHQIHHLIVAEEGRFAGMLHMDVEWQEVDGLVEAPMATFAGKI